MLNEDGILYIAQRTTVQCTVYSLTMAIDSSCIMYSIKPKTTTVYLHFANSIMS